MLKDIFKIATGVALGNTISNKHNKKNKKDLFGTEVCKRCKPNQMQTCMGCPARPRCTQQTK